VRLPSLLLSVLLVPVTTAVTVAAPVATPPEPPAPRPVAPGVVELPLEASAVAETGRRTVVATAPRGTDPFSTVGVTWTPGPDPAEVVVRVRTRGEQGWGDWTVLESEDSAAVAAGPDAGSARLRDGAGPAWAGPSDGVQVRVDVLSGSAPRDLELVLVDPGSSPADAPAAAPASVAQADDDRPVIRSRAEWGADESLRTAAPTYSRTLEAAVLHHTAGGNDYSEADVPAVLRGIYAFHVKSRGWSDIGYNVLVDRFGTAWEGRAGGLDRPVLGSHAGGFNTSTTGISMIGTFEDVAPSPAVVETVAAVAAWKLGLYGRDPGGRVTLTSAGSTSRYPAGQRVELPRIFGHRDTGSTSCPGAAGYAAVAEMRRQAGVLAAGTTPPVQPFGELEAVEGGSRALQVSGWAIDPDSSEPVRVLPVVDGVTGTPAEVSEDRPEVQREHPPYPERSGFAVQLRAEPGRREVCVVVQNQQAGQDEPLGCRTVTVEDRTAPPQARATDDSCPPARVPTVPFRDTATSVHRAAVECAVWWDVARGRDDGTFGPAEPVSRGHMALFLARTVRVSGGTLPDAPPSAFDDLARSPAEVRLAVEQLAAVGVLRGKSPRRFDPAATVTRAQMATFLAGAYEYRSGRTLPGGHDYFTDDDGSVHEAAIGKVAAAGFTGGTSGTAYSPDRSTERGQTASFVTRVLDLLVEEGTTARR
jgi:hypothetical protein